MEGGEASTFLARKAAQKPQAPKVDPPKFADVAFWFFMLFLASVTMTVGNKAVMLKFHYANTLTIMQNGTAVAYLATMTYMGWVDTKPFTAQQWQVFAVSATCLAMQILTSLMALPLVAIATVVTFRNACTVVIAFIDYFYFGNKFSTTAVGGLVVCTVGMLIYAREDLNFNFVGYMWLAGNSAASIFNTFWNKTFITKYTREKKIQTSIGVSLIQQTETLPIVFFLAMVNSEGGALGSLVELPGLTKLLVLVTCGGGVLIGIAYPKCFSLASGTSVVVASTANKAIAIIMGMYLFGTELKASQVFGLVVCIAGSLIYSVDMKRSKK